MRKLFALGMVAVVAAAAPAASPIKSVSALAFGPEGTLFIGDPTSATIVAVMTGDTTPGGKGAVAVDKLDEKLGSALGTTGANVTVTDVKVNPASGNIYLAITRGKGKEAMPVIVKLDREGKMTDVDLEKLKSTSVSIPNANDKTRMEAITSLAFVDGKVIVAGLSNEEFASTLRAIPYPFKDADKGTSVEIFHGAHGKLETNSPVRTFVPYKISGADYLLAAYTCTPLVKVPLADLKAGTKVKGTTIAELGNRNRPLDMIVYTKGGTDYVLMANSARGVMKIPTAGMDKAEPITTKPGSEKAGVAYESITELKGVMQLDKLDADRALLLVQAEDKSLSLKTIPLP